MKEEKMAIDPNVIKINQSGLSSISSRVGKKTPQMLPCFEGFHFDISKHGLGGPCPHGRSSRSLGSPRARCTVVTALVVLQGRDDIRIVYQVHKTV